MSSVNVKQYKGQPRKDWDKDHWLQHAYVQRWNPWIDEDERDYWKNKIKELQK